MRKLFILCIGIFFAQQAAASSQCTLEVGEKIHCDDCISLDDFALHGAAAMSGNYGYFSDAISPTGKSIRVTGNNGSDVVVTKRTAWDPGSLSITAGQHGKWGINFNYPSPFEAQVEASDLKNIAIGKKGYSERFPYPVLNAKCNDILEKKKEAALKALQEDLDAFIAAHPHTLNAPQTPGNNRAYFRLRNLPTALRRGTCWGTSTGTMCMRNK